MDTTTLSPIPAGTTARLKTTNGGHAIVTVLNNYLPGDDLDCRYHNNPTYSWQVPGWRVKDLTPVVRVPDLEAGQTFVHPHYRGQDGSPKTFTIEKVEAGIVFPGNSWTTENRALRFKGRGPDGTTRVLLFIDELVEVVF